ncbi:MAG: endonuclease/exonuclease/phosphatase family protein [Opitutaceae bacterium]
MNPFRYISVFLTSFFAVVIPFKLSAEDVVLTGWHDFSSAFQAHRASGDAKDSEGEIKNVTGKLWGGDGARDTWGSTDGTYGPTEAVGSTATDGAMSIRVDKDKVYFTITNGSTRNIHLSKVLFDFASVNGNSPRNLSIYYQSGGLSDPNETLLVRWESILNGLGTVSDYEDMELDLSILEDQILGPGQTATFRFQVDTANVNNQALGLDNIAILGDYADFAVVTYNIHGGKNATDSTFVEQNVIDFRDNHLQGEDVICLQEVDFQNGWWDDIKGILSDYPYTHQTINSTTVGWPKYTSIAVLSKHPIVSVHEHLVNTDPTYDKWERHGQHVQIQVGGELVHLFHYHNTHDPDPNDGTGVDSSEYAGMENFRDFILDRIDSQALSERGRIVALGDFNINGTLVDTLMPDLVDRQSDWVDHVTAMFDFENSGVYSTGASGSNISDHDAVWAEFDLEEPSPDPMTWSSTPATTSTGTITMEASAASDPHEVQYKFTNTTIGDGSHDSGWQDSATYTDAGLTEGVSYSYTVMARDKSANVNMTSASASASAISTIVYVAPPYKESFESGIGNWVQVTDDDYDWMVHSGATETAAAGPSGASEGTYYLYAEGHQGQGRDGIASVEASFDLSALSAPAIKFDYHMYGDFIDYLALDVYNGSSWTTNVWLKDNEQHSSSADPWSTALVDLAAYAGLSNVKLRFRTANTRWNAADPAIDNICIDELPTISYAQWEATAFAAAPNGTDTSSSGNPDNDSLVNLLEYAFGTDPNVSDSSAMTVDESGGTFTPGTPVVDIDFDPLSVKACFIRRVDHASSGITYTAQFSHELSTWEDLDGSTATQIFGVSESNGYEAVELNYPTFLSTGQKARFYRVKIDDIPSGNTQPE